MRTLNKVLCLVLAVVMCVGMMSIGANAAFNDADKITANYKFAVDVMTGLGVIEGKDGNVFDPAGSLTREQAAKIVVYMVLGPTNAAKIGAVNSRFTDVQGRWSSGYVEYAANLGILAGVGDNKFNPTGSLSTAAFGKMLLCALGYDAAIQGYTGEGWAIAVAADMVNAGVSDDSIVISAAVDCTREQACQLAFKCLKADVVKYAQKGTTIELNGTTIVTGASTPSTQGEGTYATIISNGTVNETLQFVEKHFAGTTIAPMVVGGLYGEVWSKGATTIGFNPTGKVLATSTNGTAYSKLVKDTDSKYIKVKADTTVVMHYNDATMQSVATGAAVTGGAGTTYYNTSKSDIFEAAAAAATDNDPSGTKAGVIVNFIDTNNNGKYDVVTLVEKTVEKLAAAPTTTTTGSVTTVTVGSLANVNADAIVYPADLAKGDVILWYASGSGKTFVEKAVAVTGTISSYVADKTVTIDGTAYAISGLDTKPTGFTSIADLAQLLGAPGYTFYLDNGKNIVYGVAPDAVATMTSVVFVYGVDMTDSFGVETYKAMVVKADGTLDTITVAKVKNTTKLEKVTAKDTAASSTDGTLGDKTFYSFTTNENGSYNLTKVATLGEYKSVIGTTVAIGNVTYTITAKDAKFLTMFTATETSWNNATKNVKDILANNSTVFLYYDANAKTFDTYTGINNVPSYTAGGNIWALYDATTKFAKVVVAMGANTTAPASSYDQIFVTGAPSVSKNANGTDVYTYSLVKNGVAATEFKSYSSLTAGTLYFVKDYDTNGIAREGMAVEVTTTAANGAVKYASLTDLAYASSVLSITAATSATPILNEKAVLFMYDTSDATVKAVTPEAAAAYNYTGGTDYIFTVATSSTDSSIAAVYIVVA